MFINWWVISPRCSLDLLKNTAELLLLDKASICRWWWQHPKMSMEALALRPKVHLACRLFVVFKGGSRFFKCMDSIPESGQ